MDSSVLRCLLPRKDDAITGCSPAWVGRRHLLPFVNLSHDGWARIWFLSSDWVWENSLQIGSFPVWSEDLLHRPSSKSASAIKFRNLSTRCHTGSPSTGTWAEVHLWWNNHLLYLLQIFCRGQKRLNFSGWACKPCPNESGVPYTLITATGEHLSTQRSFCYWLSN